MDSYLLGWESVSSTDANLKSLFSPLMALLKGIDENVSQSSIGVCGSFMTRTLIRVAPSVEDSLPPTDMCVTMPPSVCSEKDANDGLYDEKRFEFCEKIVAHLAEHVKNAIFSVVNIENRKGKKAVCANFGNGTCPIFIHPRIEDISEYLVKGMKKRGPYVSGILEDAAMPAMLKVVHNVCSTRPNYVRAIIALKAWANHTGITPAFKSPYNHSEQFQPFVFGIILAALHDQGIVSATMSEENVLRTVWVQIARGFLDGPALTMPESGFPLLNVLHRTSQRFIDVVVKPAAEEALKMAAAVDVFSAPRVLFPMLFSVVLKADFTTSEKASAVSEIVAYALSDRLSHAFVEMSEDGKSALIFARVRTADGRNKLTKGPSLEQTKESDKFSQFWGAAAVSTRQFADGSIHKCVSWGDQCFSTGRTAFGGHANPADVMLPVADVTRVIIGGALTRHVPTFASLACPADSISDVVCERIGASYLDTAPVAHKSLQQACAEAVKVVSGVQSSLACKVVGFDVVSGSARECDPYPIRPHAALTALNTDAKLVTTVPSIEPVYCVLTIDDKNKIPDTLDAIKTMKGALCAQLSNALTAAGHESYCTTISVDLAFASGYVFRIFIAHFREVSLLRALERGPQADMMERKLFWSVQHHKYVQSVLTNVHVTYSKAVRLAKRWVGAMLLGDFIAPEAVELLVGYSYLVPANKPRSAEEGLYRFFRLLAFYDWSKPLVLDPTIAVDLKKAWDREAVGMIILATYDATQSTPFTAHTPRPMIVHRLSALAAGAVRAVEEGRFGALWLCDAPSSFDVVLPLSPAMALAADRCIARPPQAPAPFRLWRAGDLVGADRQRYITQLCELEPASFCLKTLRGASRDKCMIFMDIYGPQSLSVVSLSQGPTRQQLRALVTALMEAAPKGSLGHIELPPAEEERVVKKQDAKKAKNVSGKKAPRREGEGNGEGEEEEKKKDESAAASKAEGGGKKDKKSGNNEEQTEKKKEEGNKGGKKDKKHRPETNAKAVKAKPQKVSAAQK